MCLRTGDEFYPSKIDLMPQKPTRLYEHLTLAQMRLKRFDKADVGTTRMNRIEQRSFRSRIVVDGDTANHNERHLKITYDLLPVEIIHAGTADHLESRSSKL